MSVRGLLVAPDGLSSMRVLKGSQEVTVNDEPVIVKIVVK
jgi:hypothetical protein